MMKWVQRLIVWVTTILVVVLFNLSGMAGVAQVTSISEFGDIRPTDPEFTAVQSVVERYGINVGLPDRTFRGKQPITRGDFVIYLSEAMDRVHELLAAGTADTSDVARINNDLEVVSQQLNQKSTRIARRIEQIQTRLAKLEARVTTKAMEEAQALHTGQLIAKIPTPPRSAVRDVQPGDRYYQPLENVLERYDINVLFPNLTFQGERPLIRGDFAIYFNAALNRLTKLRDSASSPLRESQERLSQLQNRVNTDRLTSQKQVDAIKGRLNQLEQKLLGR